MRCLRPTAVSIIETSPLGSAFTCGYLLRSIHLHRLYRQQTTKSKGLYETRVVEGMPEKSQALDGPPEQEKLNI